MVTESGGSASAMWHSIQRIFLSIIVLGLLFFFLAVFSKVNIDNTAEPHLFAFRTLNSEYGIANYDAVSGRVDTGVIDLTKFKNNSIPILQKSIDYGEEKHIGAKFTLKESSELPVISITNFSPSQSFIIAISYLFLIYSFTCKVLPACIYIVVNNWKP